MVGIIMHEIELIKYLIKVLRCHWSWTTCGHRTFCGVYHSIGPGYLLSQIRMTCCIVLLEVRF